MRITDRACHRDRVTDTLGGSLSRRAGTARHPVREFSNQFERLDHFGARLALQLRGVLEGTGRSR